MAMETFLFCPNTNVPTTMAPDPIKGVSMGGWTFTSKPNIPYQKRFKLKLNGLTWFLNADGTYNSTINPTINARALELFYERNGVWNPFLWNHQHLGVLTVRFDDVVTIPAGEENSAGLITDDVTLSLIHHNPAYA